MYFFSKPPSIFLEQRKTVHVVIVYHSVSRSIIPLYPRHTAINFEKPSNNVIVHNMSNIPTYLAANKSRNENHPSINDGSVYRPIIIRMAAIKGVTSLVQDPSKTTRTSGGLLRSSKRALRGSKLCPRKKAKSRPLAQRPRIQSAFIVSKVLAAIPRRCFLSLLKAHHYHRRILVSRAAGTR